MQVGGLKDTKPRVNDNQMVGSMMNSREFALKLNKYVG